MNKRRIRILHVVPDFGVGGAEMLVKNLLLHYDQRGFEVAACSLYAKKGTMIEREIEDFKVALFYLDKKVGPDARLLIKLYKLFKDFRPDIIHSHLYVIRYVLLPALICRIPAMLHTVHNVAEKEVTLFGKVVNLISFKLLGVKPIGISAEISRSIERLYRLKHVEYIYNGIPVRNYQVQTGEREKIRATLGILQGQLVVIHIGRFSIQKNHKLLIDAFSCVVAKRGDAILLLVGEGELKSDMELYVRKRGLTGKVRFLGLRSDIAGLLAASDLLVLSSDWEGSPLVLLEAMASARPVVATRVGGSAELIRDGVNGHLVEPGDSRSLSEKILSIASNPEHSLIMGERGRELADEFFDIKGVVRQYEALYLKTVAIG